VQFGELAFMDGKRLYERFQHSRQLAPKGSMGQPRRVGPKWSPGYDIGYTFVRSDGYIAPPAINTLKKLPDAFVNKFNSTTGAYLFHRDRKQERVGVNSTLEALKHYYRIGAFSSSHGRVRYLIMDNEAAENAKEIDAYCNSIGVIVLNFPAYLGHFLNICDNRVHATIQRVLDKVQEDFVDPSSPSLEEKYSAFLSAYRSVTESEILNSLASIGFGSLKSRQEAEKHFIRTLSEGLPKHVEAHAIQLEAFLCDCIDHGRDIPTSPYKFRLPGPLWDCYFDALNDEIEVKRLV